MAFHLEDILRMWEKKITSFCVYIGLFFFCHLEKLHGFDITSTFFCSAFEFASFLCCRPPQCYENQGLLLKQACVQESTKCLS